MLLRNLCMGAFTPSNDKTIPLAHQGVVTAAAFNGDGTLVVTASADSTARIWDATTGTPVTIPMVHPAAVIAATFSPDGERIATAASDSTVRLWNTHTGTAIGPPLRHRDAVRAVSFLSNGQRLATTTAHDTTRLWDVHAVRIRDRGQLLDLAEVIIAGAMRGPRDFVRGVPDRTARLQAWRTRARGWADAPDGSFEQWAHWYFADPDTRAAQPGRWQHSAHR
jgi:hypothetical protein